MSARKAVQPGRGWLKLAAALLLAGILLSGILAAPAAPPIVHALNAPPQVTAPSSITSTGVIGTLDSFTALFTQTFSINLPIVGK